MHNPGIDLDRVRQHVMHGAFMCDLFQARALFVSDVSGDRDFAFEDGFVLRALAVHLDIDALDVQFFPVGIHPQRDGRARGEGHAHKIAGHGAGVGAAVASGFVGQQRVHAGGKFGFVVVAANRGYNGAVICNHQNVWFITNSC